MPSLTVTGRRDGDHPRRSAGVLRRLDQERLQQLEEEEVREVVGSHLELESILSSYDQYLVQHEA